MTDIATIVAEYASEKAAADRHYARAKELEFELISALREQYPNEWLQWQRGVQSFKAEGATIKVDRKYDVDKLRAEFGEERPDLIEEEHEITTVVPAKANGRKINAMWKDAALARRLELCVLEPTPKVSLG